MLLRNIDWLVLQALMEDVVLLDGAFSSALTSGAAQLSAPTASMPHIAVEGASSHSTDPVAAAVGRLL